MLNSNIMDEITLNDVCQYNNLKKLKPTTQSVMVEAPQSLQRYLNKALMEEFNSNLFGVCAGLLDNKFTAEQATEVIYKMLAHRDPKAGEIERAVGKIFNADTPTGESISDWPLPKEIKLPEMRNNLKLRGIEPMSEDEMMQSLGESPEEADNVVDFINHYFNGLNDPAVYIGGMKHGAIRNVSMWLADAEEVEAYNYDQILANPMKRLLTADERASIPSGGRRKEFVSDTLDVITFESDALKPEEQLAVIAWIAQYLPLVAIVYSGGKSYHATFSLKGLTKDKVMTLRQALHGIGGDRSVMAPHQLVRLGGVNSTKLGNKLQRVLWIDSSARTRAVEAGKLAELLSDPEENSLWQFLQKREFDEMDPPPVQPPILKLGDVGVIWKGNIHTLVAPSKSGKTHAMASMIRALVTGERSLGWNCEKLTGRVVYLDFEQDAEDFYNVLAKHAGVTSYQVSAYRLAGLSALEAQQAVEMILEKIPDIDIIIMDGYADLTNDTNCSEESNGLVARWMSLVSEYDFALLGALHLNPNSDSKSRGHLGSQLERKSKTVLKIDVDAEGVRETYTQFARKQPVFKGKGVFWQWIDDGFVEVEDKATREAAEKLEIERGEFDQFLMTQTIRQWSHNALVTAIQGCLKNGEKVSESTAKRRIKQWLDNSFIFNNKTHYSTGSIPF